MEKSACSPSPTNANRRWRYYQYYLGDQDQERRRSGHGQNHWSGAESLEWYTGRFLRDMMHGQGDYRWRYKGPEGVFVTYEGQFYGNCMHGYGVMSYPDGKVFNGLFYNNVRWGPGIMSNTCLQADVGLWRGNQLVRLTWRPDTPFVTLDLNFSPVAKTCVECHRTLLTKRVQTIGEVNSAIELLKQSGAAPIAASERWTKLYPKHCTDLDSQLCHVEVFDHEYYNNNIVELEEIDTMPSPIENASDDSENDSFDSGTYYAWNNSDTMISMMKHCFKHEQQRIRSGIDLRTILTGHRSSYKGPAKHETDSRTLIMASYLGYISNVAKLINEENVHPDVADILGNTPLMYATCGDHADIVHFLVEAGANINNINDSCCTPLSVALMKFACISKDILASGMVNVFIPPTLPVPISLEKPSEWHMSRDLTVQSATTDNIGRRASKMTSKTSGLKRKSEEIQAAKRKTITTTKEKENLEEVAGTKRKTNAFTATEPENLEEETDDMFYEEKRLYNNINAEFRIRVTDLFSIPCALNSLVYLFQYNDIVKELDASEEEYKKSLDPKRVTTKVVNSTVKPSQDKLWQVSEKGEASISSADRVKIDKLNQNMATILQLLSDGADPRLVRCPQPALWIATVSGSPELVQHLVDRGADINEVYPDALNYTILDIVLSQPLTFTNLELSRVMLECGAITDHRLLYGDSVTDDPTLPVVPGPTLLHAVLVKKTENEAEEQIRCELIKLLLEYNCSAEAQFKGCSAVDVAMVKSIDVFEVFVNCPKTDLNAIINDSHQTILVKMFSPHFYKTFPVSERLQLTNLLLYGADPLLECQDGDEKYANIFVLAKKNKIEIEKGPSKPIITPAAKSNVKMDPKGKKTNDKPKKDDKTSKSVTRTVTDDLGDYKQALEMVTECARVLHIRWIQAQLLKELIKVVEKYEHRQWNMILPEHKNKTACGRWLTYSRSLEIWDILKPTRKKNINDRRILKHVLCIVHFNCDRAKTTFKWPLTAKEKGLIEADVNCILREHKLAENMAKEDMECVRPYVTPELAVGAEGKFQVCFECALPFEEQKIPCIFCKQVSFCSYDCMKRNIDHYGCHPCSEYLRNKYFPTPSDSVTQTDILGR